MKLCKKIEHKAAFCFIPDGLFFILLKIFLILQILLNQNLFSIRSDFKNHYQAEYLEKLAPFHSKWYEIISIRQIPSCVDWIWIQALANSPNQKNKTPYPSLFSYDLALITDLDPKFYLAYIAGSQLLLAIEQDGKSAKTLLLKGKRFLKEVLPTQPTNFIEREWQNPWQISLLLAYNYLFELDDMPSAAIEFSAAAQMQGSPEYLRRLEKKFQSPGGMYVLGIRLLAFLESGRIEEKIKLEYKKKRENLSIAYYLFDMNAKFQNFLEKRKSTKKTLVMQWKEFLKIQHLSSTDPWGGTLQIMDSGKITSNTPYQKIFNLE